MARETSDDGSGLISRTVVWWLLATACTFLLGFLILDFFPRASSPTWGGGIGTNVGMAVALGVFLGWTRQWIQVLVASIFGSFVVILGLDLLFLAPTPTENTHLGLIGMVLFDSVTVVVALVGMMILVGLGALIGALTRVVSKCRCLAKFANQIRESGGRWCPRTSISRLAFRLRRDSTFCEASHGLRSLAEIHVIHHECLA
jgi:hypothetical protein